MNFSELSEQQLAKIRRYRYDRIVEKHEGPWDWASTLRYSNPEFLAVNGASVLLPVERTNHVNITVVRSIPSADRQVLTIFLRDTTYFDGMDSGFLAICERVPDESWFIATVYHEWFFTDYVRGGKAEPGAAADGGLP